MKITLDPVEEVINPADLMTEKEKFSQMDSKQKLEHIWTYYKFPILGGLLVLLLAVYFIHQAFFVVKKDPALSLLVVNGTAELTSEEIDNAFTPYLEAQGFDMSLSTVNANTSLYLDASSGANSIDPQSYSVFMTLAVAQEEDLLITDSETIAYLTGQGLLEPLTDIFTEDELAQLDDRIINGTDSETEKEAPCAVNISDTTDDTITQFGVPNPCVAIFYNSPQRDTAIAYLKSLVE